jgi:hypothetical protein
MALFGALAFVAACSGQSASGSMSPTGPSSFSAGTGTMFGINPDDPCEINPTAPECQPPEEDPCVPTIDGLRINPEDPDPCVGRFTGGGFQFDENDVRVTRGFTIHCDNLLTNNLEINWAGGQNFHLDKNSLSDIVCTLPNEPNPPVAPVSRIDATGTGTLNSLPGAVITFTLIDRGEPGKDNDEAALHIEFGGQVVLDVPLGPIDGGNIQAHYDQPHGNKPEK